MGKLTRPSAARLKEILRRQDPPGWGAHYEAAIRATREEAPPKSRPAQIWCELLKRDIHALSTPEKRFVLIAMIYPGMFEIHDQRMLHCMASAHPLDLHPRGGGVIRPRLRGTLEVCEALGFLKFHAEIAVPGVSTLVPYPWVGDLLLFLEDEQGLYCVNWTIKESPADFQNPRSFGRPSRNPGKAALREKVRHQVEAVYYQDVGIPTRRLTGEDYDLNLTCNLEQLVLWTRRKHCFSPAQTRDIVSYFVAAVGTQIPALELAYDLASSYCCRLYDIKIVLHQAIWQRQIRIDLFQPFLIDYPLKPEKNDPVKVYAEWFARSM